MAPDQGEDAAVSMPPDPDVLAAFGLAGLTPQPLSGGQGATWRVGAAVLKPVDDETEAEWTAAVLAELPEAGFRISRPIPARSGAWTSGGWSASRCLEGAHDFAHRWPEVLVAGGALNDALRDVARPPFLDQRDHDWAVGDRAAWDEVPLILTHPDLDKIAQRLQYHVVPTELTSQVIHGDLGGNVLFADGVPPAVIDFTPYWRPGAFSLAVVVADAVAWRGAGPELARALPERRERKSLLARAAIYRLVTSDRIAGRLPGDPTKFLADEIAAHGRICALLDADLT